MSDIESSGGAETTATEGGAGRKGQAKAMMSQAGQTLKQEAQSFASVAQERARSEAQKRTQTATKTLGDFATAVRRAGEDLAAHDQSPAARLVGQAADGLEAMSRTLADKRPEELLNAVRDFGRRNPAAFIGGAVLAGFALGRFVRASETAQVAPGMSGADEGMAMAEEEALMGAPELAGGPGGTIGGAMRDEVGGVQTSTLGETATAPHGEERPSPTGGPPRGGV